MIYFLLITKQDGYPGNLANMHKTTDRGENWEIQTLPIWKLLNVFIFSIHSWIFRWN